MLPLLLLLADPPAVAPKPVPATRAEVKDLLEAHKTARPRLPLPPEGEGAVGRVNNARFRRFYLPPEVQFAGLGGRDADPDMTLDNTFKVKLFWVTSRANNCYYCLGHQEHKLRAAGVRDRDIAALDGDWTGFGPKERAALRFTRKLTFEPHAVGPADVQALRGHYTPPQVLELTLAVAGFNAMNRWTDGLNIPAEADGGFFKKDGADDLHTFQTPTDPADAGRVSGVAPLPTGTSAAAAPSYPPRPASPDRAAIEAAWAQARTPALPLADEAAARPVWGDGTVPHWGRLLATFPKAGGGWVKRLRAGAAFGKLSPRLKAEIAWVTARHDRAWYALAVARARLRAVGLSDAEVFALDADGAGLPATDKRVVGFARKLSVSPALVTDADVEGLRAVLSDTEVAEVVHHVTDAAFVNRVTAVADLPPDR